MHTNLSKAYAPGEHEDEIYKQWEDSGLFNPDVCVAKGIAKADAKPFSIVLPPPNATGHLHIGHAVMLALQDVMVRYHRMKGDRTLWVPGTDHASIATESKVEKILMKEDGIKNPKAELGREAFVKLVEDFVAENRGVITNQCRKMGASLDWKREAYTLDEERARAVRSAFKRMYDEGIIYRGYRVVNWSVAGQSTCSDDELVTQERKTTLYTFKYSKNFPIAISTTRPETKLGDTAVAVHPQDERYQEYIGQTFAVDVGAAKPLEIKIIANEKVEKDFGTGALGVTPAHSIVDFEMYEAQKAAGDPIGLIQVIGEDGRMTAAAGGAYEGLTVLEARDKFVAWLRKNDLIENEEEMNQNVATSDRFEDVVEPLPKMQWWINVNKEFERNNETVTLKKLMQSAVLSGAIRIVPERFEKIYFNWINNLRDWNISRQLYFGHRIPAWYRQWKPQGDEYVMGFHERTEAQVKAGKTKTYRLRDHGLKAGDSFALENSQTETVFGYGTIMKVEKMSVGDIDLEDKAHGATYRRQKDLIAAFQFHHPQMDVRAQTPVWVYTYSFGEMEQDGRVHERYIGTEAPADDGWQQDADTLDTWFSSGLWTFSTLGWPNEKAKDLKLYHPTSVLETGHDILFFWVARMILMSQYLVNQVPFKTVYLHGLVRDEKGRKMSKSLGNVIDPLDIIPKYGTDAIRLALMVGTTPGNDVKLGEDKIASYRNFTNKLWNISRYILGNYQIEETVTHKEPSAPQEASLADIWVGWKMGDLIKEVTEDIEAFRFSQAGEKLRDFTWNDFADWYLEISKFEKGSYKGALLRSILDDLLKLWHPFMPFVTEAVYQEWRVDYKVRKDFLMVEEWPQPQRYTQTLSRSKDDFNVIINVITAIRSLRADMDIKPGENIKVVLYAHGKVELLQSQEHLIKSLRTNIGELAIEKTGEKIKQAAYAVVDGVEIFIPLNGLVDLETEKTKLIKHSQELKSLIDTAEHKLDNEEFVRHAPKDIVQAEIDKLEKYRDELKKVKEQATYLK